MISPKLSNVWGIDTIDSFESVLTNQRSGGDHLKMEDLSEIACSKLCQELHHCRELNPSRTQRARMAIQFSDTQLAETKWKHVSGIFAIEGTSLRVLLWSDNIRGWRGSDHRPIGAELERMVIIECLLMEVVSIAIQHPLHSLYPVVKDEFQFRSLNFTQKFLNASEKILWPGECCPANAAFICPKSQNVPSQDCKADEGLE
jgi:hypothetical protein